MNVRGSIQSSPLSKLWKKVECYQKAIPVHEYVTLVHVPKINFLVIPKMMENVLKCFPV